MSGNRLFGIIIAATIVAVLVLGWVVGISPVLGQITQANTELQAVNAENQAHQIQLDALKTQYESMPELRKELAELQLAAPQTADIEGFLDDLQSLASAAGVTISTVTIGEATLYGMSVDGTPVVQAAAPPATTEEGTDTTTEGTAAVAPTAPTSGAAILAPSAALKDKLYTLPVSFSVSGPTDGVAKFILGCQIGPRLFLLTTWSLSGIDAGSATSSGEGFIYVVQDPAAGTLEPYDPNAESDPTPDSTPTPSESPTPTPTESPAP